MLCCNYQDARRVVSCINICDIIGFVCSLIVIGIVIATIFVLEIGRSDAHIGEYGGEDLNNQEEYDR